MTESHEPEGLPVELEDISPLRGLVTEVHELYEELKAVGFPERAVAQIIAHLLYDSMAYRGDAKDEDEDEDDDEDVLGDAD